MAEAEQSNGFDRVVEVPVRAGNALGRVLGSVLDVGRDILARRGLGSEAQYNPATLIEACRELLDHRGEASGLALASRIGSAYLDMDDAAQLEFFNALASEFDVDSSAIVNAVER